ncbi:glycosyltransferase [Pseudoroseomonas wenyumeiae]
MKPNPAMYRLAETPQALMCFLGRLPSDSGILPAAYQAAAACAQVTWAEGASLAALEAWASDCPLILSSLPGNIEYFGTDAVYADPSNVQDIRDKIFSATGPMRPKSSSLREILYRECSYEGHVNSLAAIYINLGKTKSLTVS